MTDDMIALRELLEKGSDATLLREMIGFAAQRPMEWEAETACGAGHGERSESRTNLRNGYRDRDWHTRVGTVELRIRTRARAAIFGSGSRSACVTCVAAGSDDLPWPRSSWMDIDTDKID